MADPNDLARRYLVLWSEYLAALFAELGAMASPDPTHFAERPQAAGPGPAENAEQPQSPGSQAGAAPAAGASGERDDAVAEFARRLADLEDRVAQIERGRREAARPRRRNRRARG